MAENRLPFGDPLAPDGTMHKRLKDLVCDLARMGITLKEATEELERLYIESTLRSCGGNRSQTARRLGIHRNTLNTKMDQHKIDGAGG